MAKISVNGDRPGPSRSSAGKGRPAGALIIAALAIMASTGIYMSLQIGTALMSPGSTGDILQSQASVSRNAGQAGVLGAFGPLHQVRGPNEASIGRAHMRRCLITPHIILDSAWSWQRLSSLVRHITIQYHDMSISLVHVQAEGSLTLIDGDGDDGDILRLDREVWRQPWMRPNAFCWELLVHDSVCYKARANAKL